MRNILIVGASSAMAQACARQWAQRGDRLFLAARQEAAVQAAVVGGRGQGLLKSVRGDFMFGSPPGRLSRPLSQPRPGAIAMNSLIARRGLLDDFLNDVAPAFYVKPLHGDNLPAQIRVDVQETPDAYTLLAEVPGVSKEDIQVNVDGKVVTLRAEIKQQDSQSEGGKLLRSERYYGAVSRSFQLPVDIDNSAAKAKYENGVLQLTLPKKTAGATQRLTIE